MPGASGVCSPTQLLEGLAGCRNSISSSGLRTWLFHLGHGSVLYLLLFGPALDRGELDCGKNPQLVIKRPGFSSQLWYHLIT